jgi:hypothetical protein
MWRETGACVVQYDAYCATLYFQVDEYPVSGFLDHDPKVSFFSDSWPRTTTANFFSQEERFFARWEFFVADTKPHWF